MKRTLNASPSQGVKHDQDKPRFDLLPPEALKAAVEVFSRGALKYGARNWEQGISAGRLFAAVQRHLWAFWAGEDLDLEWGQPHLAHALCALMMLFTTIQRHSDLDDRPKKSG
jgi:hypothetical protein